MKIEQLSITGLKGTDKSQFQFSDKVVISGPNGSGKTTILESIGFLFGQGIQGQKIDGTRILPLLSGDQGIAVEATVSHLGHRATLKRWRDPTSLGLGRSKASIEYWQEDLIPEEVKQVFTRSMEGGFQQVSHAHEWLSMRQSDLRKMIGNLGADQVKSQLPNEISIRLKRPLPEGLIQVAADLKEEATVSRREIRVLQQSFDSLAAQTAFGSPEEMTIAQTTKRTLESKLYQARENAGKIRDELVITNHKLRNLPSFASTQYVVNMDSAFRSGLYSLTLEELLYRKDDIHGKLATHERDLARTEQTLFEHKKDGEVRLEALKAEIKLLESFASSVNQHECPLCHTDLREVGRGRLNFEIVLSQKQARVAAEGEGSDVDFLCSAIDNCRSEISHLKHEAQDVCRVILEKEKHSEWKELSEQLRGLEKVYEEKMGEIDIVQRELLDNQSEIITIQNAIAQSRLKEQISGDVQESKKKISEIERLLTTAENFISIMARHGTSTFLERVNKFFIPDDRPTRLGSPAVEDGKIGLRDEAGIFYAGIALSGSERDLLALAVDCAMKEGVNAPKLILVEADSVDGPNFRMITEALSKTDLDQVFVAYCHLNKESHSYVRHCGWSVLDLTLSN